MPHRPLHSAPTALAERVAEATAFVRRRWDPSPRAGLIFGTGMGALAEAIDVDVALPYADIPHLPPTTAPGHRGRLLCGRWEGAPVVALDGRFHRYEGHSAQTVGLPIRAMRRLGADRLIVTNASGGLNPQLHTGDVVALTEHVNLMWDNPLAGLDEAELAEGLPAMFAPYDPALVETALGVARREGFVALPGVYVAMTGPSYETRAEYRMLRRLGADVVGMSTVPEVIVAAHCGMRVLALSVVTNVAHPDLPDRVSAQQVLSDASRAAPHVREIVRAALAV